MRAQEALSLLSARSNALRTATAANFSAARSNLMRAITQVSGAQASAVASGQWNASDANRVSEALRSSTYTYNNQRAPVSGGGSSSGGGVVQTLLETVGFSSPEEKARAQRGGGSAPAPRSGGGGGGGGSQRQSDPDELDLGLDTGGGQAIGLFSAIGRTISGNFTGSLGELWNPTGASFFQRPVARLFLLTTGLAIAVGGGAIAVSSLKKKSPRLESARADISG